MVQKKFSHVSPADSLVLLISTLDTGIEYQPAVAEYEREIS